MADHWLSFWYQYIVGGVFFFAIIFLAMRSRTITLSSREGRNTVLILVGGLIAFFCIHYFWTYAIMGK